MGGFVEDLGHSRGGTDGECGFLDDEFVGLGVSGDVAGGFLPVLEVCGVAGAAPECFGRGVDSDEYDVVFSNALFEVGGKEEVLAAAGFYEFFKSGFVDGQGV